MTPLTEASLNEVLSAIPESTEHHLRPWGGKAGGCWRFWNEVWHSRCV